MAAIVGPLCMFCFRPPSLSGILCNGGPLFCREFCCPRLSALGRDLSALSVVLIVCAHACWLQNACRKSASILKIMLALANSKHNVASMVIGPQKQEGPARRNADGAFLRLETWQSGLLHRAVLACFHP